MFLLLVLEFGKYDSKEDKPRFPEWFDKDIEEVEEKIDDDWMTIIHAVDSDFQIEKLDSNHNTVLLAQNNLIQNLELLSIITNNQLSIDQIQIFFQQLEFFTFSDSKLEKMLNGLSSYDGKKIYLSKKFLDKSKGRKTIEHEIVHDLIRWINKENNPRLISPEKYSLKIEGKMIESGHFYEAQAYKIEFDCPSPFCLNVPKRRKIF